MKVQIEVTHKKSEKGPKYKRRQIDRGPTDRQTDEHTSKKIDRQMEERT